MRGGNEIHEEFDRGRFPGSVRANEGVEGTFRNVEIDVIDSGQAAETLCQLLCVNGWGHGRLSALLSWSRTFLPASK